jgi:hypothetical protein
VLTWDPALAGFAQIRLKADPTHDRPFAFHPLRVSLLLKVSTMLSTIVPGRHRAAQAKVSRTVAVLAVLLASAAPASAQVFETVGVRALGMGGAFVAVADDVTAVYWNPAGLANSAILDASVQYTRTERPKNPGAVNATMGGWQTSTTFVGFALPSLGLNYLHTRTERVLGPTAASGDVRQQDRPGVAVVNSLAVDQLGVTFLQSLLPNVVAGSTLKLARGSAAATSLAPGLPLSGAWEQGAQLSADAKTKFDFDLGVLALFGPLRLGLVGRNIREADFAPDDTSGSGRLQRQVRLGVGFTPGFTPQHTAAARPSLTIAFDADLTSTPWPGGDQRHVAAGVEWWIPRRIVGLRAGVRANTIGDARTVGTAGASVALRRWMLVEGQYASGTENAGQQWTVGGRLTF